MEHIEIRSVSAGDAEFLFQLMNEPTVMKALNEVPTEKRDWEEAVSAWSEDADEEGYIVLRSGQPAGWFAVNGLLADDHTAFLKMAVLLPAYQGKHIGRYVITKIKENLQSRGILSIALFTNQSNLKAQKCYAKCGFKVIDTLTEEMSDHTIADRYKMACQI
ncbi:MAG: GNAT family N-acetyltransferase [Oscillospiraceae bacterium]|nr:GNAT family N-acetyltransferase [Oscillospiraceae bacterium]